MTEENLAVPTATAMDILGNALDKEEEGFNPIPVIMKINHQEARFSLPSMPPSKTLKGIILAAKRVRVFFPRMAQEVDTKALLELTSNRPFCSSRDYVHGELADIPWDTVADDSVATILKDKIADGGLDCHACPLNEWGSMDILGRQGRGKACAELRRLLYWTPGMAIPVIVPVPTSSIRAWDAYCSALMASGLNARKVETEIGLELKEAGGMKWSVMTFDKSGNLTEAMAQELVTEVLWSGQRVMMVKALIDMFNGREIGVEDYPTNGSSGDTVATEEPF